MLPTIADIRPTWHRGPNPDTAPARWYDLEIQGIEVEGELAQAVVRHGMVTERNTLVKIGDRWYIAGIHTIRVQP